MADVGTEFTDFLIAYCLEDYNKLSSDSVTSADINAIFAKHKAKFDAWRKIPQWQRDKYYNKVPEELLEKAALDPNFTDAEAIENEKKYLIPLPNKNILEKYKQNIEYRKVTQDSMIVYRGNRYSVPTRFIGSYLGIRIIDNQVCLYDNTELIRCHKVSDKNLNYNNEDKIEILKSDLLFGLNDKEIENKINNTELQIYDFLKGMN